ncbi:MAG: hypothetical protein HOE88_00090 [Flavobacteriales bacterium]|jgi:hypothetical protein|nr:hypothetical protein [Flavobacteriales bacterium]MBT3572006.1 hypothetical protein [Flavobacteriales bacterium]MBT3677666.1 hypothetical protein [Flavobacteriales bacterium]MBT3739809.1 hypothetical protein [Flavobacteriales bacterium]MBT4101771.1 hypothetical protein [Flavobacteriales bacterium]
MKTLFQSLALCSLIAMASCTHIPIDPLDSDCDPGTVDFTTEILPLIVSNCAMSGCHVSPDAADGLDLTSYAGIMEEVKPGDPNDSELFEVLTETGDDLMPPPPSAALTSSQIAVIRMWIDQGAKNTDCGGDCDTTAATTYTDVATIIASQCLGCHQGAQPSGGVDLSTYSMVTFAVSYQNLTNTLHGIMQSPQMPPTGAMSDCNIGIINRWVRSGMPQ